MTKKNRLDKNGFVYSTDPEFQLEMDNESILETLLPHQQKLKIRLDTKHRGGKVVTLIDGFIGQEKDLEELSKKLKNYCGTGGSSKENEVIIQGDQRDKVFHYLINNGYKNVKKI